MLADMFSRMATTCSRACGRPITFIIACLSVILWAALGPIYNYSDTWQLVINTGTTVITFLIVFLIQNSQNRDTAALNLKLDELILATSGARNEVAATELLSEKDIKLMKKTNHE